MKLAIASDIHGSAMWCQRMLEAVEAENPDALVLLGDLLYHGPRNQLPDGHDPAQVAQMLNEWASRIVAVRGNCDAEVDQMMLDFACMGDYALIFDGQTRLFATHGHLYGPACLPALPPGSVLFSGHTHVKRDEVVDGIRCINPGSTSIPKDGSHSFAIYEDGALQFKLLS